MKIKEILIVLTQFATGAYILLSAPVFPTTAGLLALEIASFLLGAWAFAEMVEVSKFSVFPKAPKGSKLVAQGPYKYIRHPMYGAVILFVISLVLAYPTPLRAIVFLILFADLIFKIKIEEDFLQKDIQGYGDYKKRTHRLIPFIY